MDDTQRDLFIPDPGARLEWLLNLAFALTIAAREEYLQVDPEPTRVLEVFRCYNELWHRIASQAAKSVHPQKDDVCDDRLFIATLGEIARHGEREEQLIGAMEQATRWLKK